MHTALNTLTPAETNLQAAAAPPPLSQKQEQTEPQSFEILNPVYNKIPNPTRQMWNVNLPKPDNPFDPGEINTKDEPDLYPPLTLVKVMATLTPTTDEILQIQRKKINITHVIYCCVVRDLTPATAGNTRLDLAAAHPLTITTTDVILIWTKVWGPVGKRMHALLIGKSSTTKLGLFILPEIINSVTVEKFKSWHRHQYLPVLSCKDSVLHNSYLS